MSMRAAFTTEFIYDGAKGFEERANKMVDILSVGGDYVAPLGGGNMVGQLSGITRGLDLAEEDIRRWLLEMCYELSKVTIVPFRIVWLLEGGDLICKEIIPSSPQGVRSICQPTTTC